MSTFLHNISNDWKNQAIIRSWAVATKHVTLGMCIDRWTFGFKKCSQQRKWEAHTVFLISSSTSTSLSCTNAPGTGMFSRKFYSSGHKSHTNRSVRITKMCTDLFVFHQNTLSVFCIYRERYTRQSIDCNASLYPFEQMLKKCIFFFWS